MLAGPDGVVTEILDGFDQTLARHRLRQSLVHTGVLPARFSYGSSDTVRPKLRAVLRLLTWIDTQGLTLESLDQSRDWSHYLQARIDTVHGTGTRPERLAR